MKRFIDIGTQTGEQEEGVKEFAFYCTVIGEFESHGISMTWATKQEFIDDYEGNELGRYLILIPDGW